ncbi:MULTISPECIES: tRNA pseudouridine(55) synthase TruB [unclassified Exiguobacterium]|uniref:tRNA pseudouridine(55) synthase TruB n=1 Tax=unclassified Exiguobacterium TaxID=2644629 RepID=UPI000EEBFF8E|nr:MULTISPECIES: tRNA pseudouridine(55) synthase TruB [unclassified Exiguobacterium]HAB34338.1 tRNA pseudouridine(55) synthase TruB [Exiguobacterium sp.]
MEPIGVLPLDKPAGMTSHDCVFRLRRLFQTKKVGHTGTLDPEVTGVLPICLGRATKLARFITDEGKRYAAEVTIGFATTTEDAHGETVRETAVEPGTITEEAIADILTQLTGEIEQTPPYYSAVKVNGKKLYEYARKGIEVERPTRIVRIDRLERTSDLVFEGGLCRFRLDIACGKGTYIRTLAVEIGERLGYAAHMSELRRTGSGAIAETDTVTLETLESYETVEERMQHVLPIEHVIQKWPRLTVDASTAQRVLNGAKLTSIPVEFELFTVYNEEDVPLALYRRLPEEQVARVEVMLQID